MEGVERDNGRCFALVMTVPDQYRLYYHGIVVKDFVYVLKSVDIFRFCETRTLEHFSHTKFHNMPFVYGHHV